MKERREEAERLNRLPYAKTQERKPPPLRCGGCGMDGADHWKPDGTFIRLFAFSGDRWDTKKIYCEFCLEPHTGVKPNERA